MLLLQPEVFAASPAPSPTIGAGAEACDPAVGPPRFSRFQGIGRVSLFNGVYSLDHIDLARPDSIAATFSRGYASADTRSNHMGVGWTSNYDVRLRSDTNKDLLFTNPFGFVSRFLNAYSETTTDTHQRLTLSPPRPDWVATDGITTWRLDGPSGNLVRVETAGGASLDINYDGHGPTDTIGPDGTGLRFKLDAKGRFVQVTDRLDKQQWIKFAYDANGRLSQVDRPSGTIERYAYVGVTQRIQTISNGLDEPLLLIDYDERGRTIKERDAQGMLDGQGVEYRYEELPDGSVRTTATYPESRLDPSWRPIQSTIHDSKGNLVELVIQPTRMSRFVGSYAYNAANRRVVIRDACQLAPAAELPGASGPESLLDAVLTLLTQFVWQLVAPF